MLLRKKEKRKKKQTHIHTISWGINITAAYIGSSYILLKYAKLETFTATYYTHFPELLIWCRVTMSLEPVPGIRGHNENLQ